MRVAGHGVAITVPDGWEARITRRGSGPVLHAASFALASSDGDFGSAATGRMRLGDTFLACVEYVDPASIRPGIGLFAPSRPTPPALAEFSAHALQVGRPGQLGWQRFFSHDGRCCCLYAVIRPGAEPPRRQVKRLGAVLASLVLTTSAG